jgi:signal peptidase I
LWASENELLAYVNSVEESNGDAQERRGVEMRDMRQAPSAPYNHRAAQQRAHLMREVVEVLVFIGVTFLVVNFTIKAFLIPPNAGMSPQLAENQWVLVNKAAYFLGGPGRGDVVVFQAPDNPAQLSIKRVIAVPGDTITLTATTVSVNKYTLKEPYISTIPGDSQNPVIVNQKVEANKYYVMGDDRIPSAGSDSRTFGAVPRQNIVGKAVLVFWPISAFHFISSYGDVFSKVPSP